MHDVHSKSATNRPNDLVYNREMENKTSESNETQIKKEPKFFDEFNECK